MIFLVSASSIFSSAPKSAMGGLIALFIAAVLSLETQRIWPMDLKLKRSSERQNFTPMLLVTSNRTGKITDEYGGWVWVTCLHYTSISWPGKVDGVGWFVLTINGAFSKCNCLSCAGWW